MHLVVGVTLSLLVLAVILLRWELLATPWGFGLIAIAIASAAICLRAVPRGSHQAEWGIPILAATLSAAVTVLSIWAQLTPLDRTLHTPMTVAQEVDSPVGQQAESSETAVVAEAELPPSAAEAPVLTVNSLETDRLARAQILGTLADVLSEARSDTGLWPTTLATTSDGIVFDPLSSTPDRVLAALPPGSTLRYGVSPDGLRMTMRLTGADPAATDVVYDSAVGTVS